MHAEGLQGQARAQPPRRVFADPLGDGLAHRRRFFRVEQRRGAGLARIRRGDTGREQQASLARVAEGIAGQTAVLGKLQEGESHLVHLQAVLHQNLAAIAGASAFEEAVHSLTAAVHLLTARAAGTPAPGSPRFSQGKAA